MNLSEYGYVIAGIGSYCKGMEKQSIQKINPFQILRTLKINGLMSFGTLISNSNKQAYGEKYIKSFLYSIESVKDLNYFLLDSGGYQCATGKIPIHRIDEFIQTYYDFLFNHSQVVDDAFALDLPPDEKVFSSEEQLYEKNINSYMKIYSLPEEIRKKIIFVYHFRTPMVYRVWESILTDPKINKQINSPKFAIGGVVTGLHGEGSIPIITISLPITRIVNYIISNRLKQANIHILGGCAYKDVLFYEFIRGIAKREFDIDLKFTFDSSGLYRLVCMGRKIDLLDKSGQICTYSLRSKNTNIESNNVVMDFMNEILQISNVDYRYTINTFYDEYNNKFNPIAETLLYFAYPYFFYKLQSHCREFVEENLDLYYNDSFKFSFRVREKLAQIGAKSISKRFILKSESFVKSLDFFRDMNLTSVEKMIYKHLAADEFKFESKFPKL